MLRCKPAVNSQVCVLLTADNAIVRLDCALLESNTIQNTSKCDRTEQDIARQLNNTNKK